MVAITSRFVGNVGSVSGYASVSAKTGVLYRLPPAPYGWEVVAAGSAPVTINWVDLSASKTIHSFTGNSSGTGASTAARSTVQNLATTIGIGVTFSSTGGINAAGFAPRKAEGGNFETPPVA